MLLLNPRLVTFGAATWDGIAAVAIDRAAHRTIEEWTDLGPYAAAADIPEERIRIRITQELARDSLDTPRTGQQATISFYTAPTLGDAGRKKVSATAVVLAVEHEVSLKRAIRTITLAAISDGQSDPIQITDASNGST